MNAGQILKANEASALRNGEFLANVTGKTTKSKKKKGSLGAAGFITGIIVIFLAIFSSGNLIPSALSERLIEETDMQYADAVESKKIVFEQALENGDLPDDTVRILKTNGVLVGYYDENTFVETNKHPGGLTLVMGNKIITPQEFITEVSADANLYNAFDKATYSRSAYYYDESARKVFRQIGTNRNNFSEESNFDEVMDDLIGSGSNVNVNSVSLVKKTRTNEQTGKEETYYEYTENGATASSKTEADSFIEQVKNKNLAANETEASLYSADALKVADTISKEQRSSLFYLAIMENISKMKAGEGSSSKINEAMNYLYQDVETEVVDVETGEVIKMTGTALESPSLYAILSGEKIDVNKVKNFSSDRILKVVENQLNAEGTLEISDTVASTSDKINGSIGRFIKSRAATATNVVNTASPIVDDSLINNSYKTIKGINAGEFLVEGAINVGRKLAKESGATAGDAAATSQYARLNNTVLAMDAKIDRINRSPFDITSRNTFLGAIVYKTATILAKNNSGLLSGIKSFGTLVSQSVMSFLPSSYADEAMGYLNNYGDCQTIPSSTNAVASAQCIEIATFDTSTLNDPFRDNSFISFIKTNTPFYRLELTYNNGEKTVVTYDGETKNFIISDKKFHRLPKNHKYPVVLFLPSDLNLISHSPSRRRDYFDRIFGEFDDNYSNYLSKYEKALKQRNELLKTPNLSKSSLFSWNVLLAKYGINLFKLRKKFIQEINQHLTPTYHSIAENEDEIEIVYKTDVIKSDESGYLNILEQNYQKDLYLGHTSFGVHRDDYVFNFNHKIANGSASRGETRSVILALKFIEANLIYEKQRKKPIILLDDVFSELDPVRRKCLIKNFQNHQVIITSVEAIS